MRFWGVEWCLVLIVELLTLILTAVVTAVPSWKIFFYFLRNSWTKVTFHILHFHRLILSFFFLFFVCAAQAAEADSVGGWGTGDGWDEGPPDSWWSGGGHRTDGRSTSTPRWGRHLPHHLPAHLQGHAHGPTGWDTTRLGQVPYVGSQANIWVL